MRAKSWAQPIVCHPSQVARTGLVAKIQSDRINTMGRHGLVGVNSAHIGGAVPQISADSAPGNDFASQEMRPA